jgi:hypothetical protein
MPDKNKKYQRINKIITLLNLLKRKRAYTNEKKEPLIQKINSPFI